MIVVDASKCSGCLRCEVNCSFSHTGRVGRTYARIRVAKREIEGLDFPVVCHQCVERYCLKCPEGALEIGPLGQIMVSPTLCVACGICEKQCPIGAVELVDDIPRVCDLCGGDPRCVQACTLGAIRFEPDRIETVSLAEYKPESRGLDSEGKRFQFAVAVTRELLAGWHRIREI